MPLERLHAVLVYSVSQKFHDGGCEHALCRVDLQAVLLKDGEDLPEMLVCSSRLLLAMMMSSK